MIIKEYGVIIRLNNYKQYKKDTRGNKKCLDKETV